LIFLGGPRDDAPPRLGDLERGMVTRKSNDVRRLREEQLMSKAELARRAGVSVLTIDRVERGNQCRVDTKRKIILALGMELTERRKVFFDAREEN
jgi:DNA-binding XRE family transcriptional regulator